MNVPKTITSKDHVRQLMAYMASKLGLGYHPDDDPRDYIKYNCKPMWSEEECRQLDKLHEQAFLYCSQHGVDIYLIAFEEIAATLLKR